MPFPRSPLLPLLMATVASAALAGPSIIPLSPATVLERIGDPPSEPLRGDIRLQIDAPVLTEALSAESHSAVYIFTLELTPPDVFEINVVAPTPEGDSRVVADGEQVNISRPLPAHGQEPSGSVPSSRFSRIDLAMAGSGPSILLPITMGLPSPTLEAMTEPGTFDAQLEEPREVQGVICDVVKVTQDSGGAQSIATLAVERETGLLRRVEIEMPTGIEDMPCRLIEEFIFLERGPETTSAPLSPEIAQ